MGLMNAVPSSKQGILYTLIQSGCNADFALLGRPVCCPQWCDENIFYANIAINERCTACVAYSGLMGMGSIPITTVIIHLFVFHRNCVGRVSKQKQRNDRLQNSSSPDKLATYYHH